MSEEALPDEIDKLEITPALPGAKIVDNNLPITLNPFYEPISEPTTPPIRITTNCRKCRMRRRSESVLDDFKLATELALDATLLPSTSAAASANRTTPRVHRQPFKKNVALSAPTAGGGRKPLIREPVLRALQCCLHPHGSMRRKLLPVVQVGNSANQATGETTASAQSVLPLQSRGMSDFRDLINECQTLLEQNVDFSGRLNQLGTSRRSKNFTTMQPPPASYPTGTVGSLDLSSIITSRNASPSPSLEPCTTSRTNASTSCSQQAGSGAAACDDVTIDELASYFDTLVYIPKKMSTMAEMMYI